MAYPTETKLQEVTQESTGMHLDVPHLFVAAALWTQHALESARQCQCDTNDDPEA